MSRELEAAERAYDRGDFAEVRRCARAVLASDASAPDKIRAHDLLSRLAPDRAALVLLAACVLLFIAIVVSYASR